MIGFRSASSRVAALPLLALVLGACPADDVPPASEGSSGTSTAPETSSTTAVADSTGASEGGQTSSTGGASCGDGVVDAGEACDDGNTDDGDGCSATCQPESCALVWSWSEPVAMGNPGANETVVDASGNVYVVGVMEAADSDLWVAKWGPDGTQAWSRSIDQGGIDVGVGITVDDAGDVYVAGRVTGDGDAMYFARLAGSDGSEMWSQIVDSMFAGEDDIAEDIDLTPDGDVVVAGRMRVGMGDDDVWVSRRSAVDGSEVWSTTWSGTGDGSFSTDRVGSMDIAPNGMIWVSAREHVAFDIQEAVILGFDSDGNQMVYAAPLADGLPHQHNPFEVSAYDGGVYWAFSHANAPYRAWIYQHDESGNELSVLDQDGWPDDVGEDYVLRALDVDDAGNLGLGGYFTMTGGPSGHEWTEAWVARLDPDGNEVCRGGHMEDDGAPFAPVLTIFSGGSSPGGGIGLSGRADEGAGTDSWLWTGYFAP